ncbi:hypothetical protein [Stieleria sp.]|uniref:hypothetical protein n=1 Tax=Stieleria sp. TaxID=2795976 RepID=UPI003568DA7C
MPIHANSFVAEFAPDVVLGEWDAKLPPLGVADGGKSSCRKSNGSGATGVGGSDETAGAALGCGAGIRTGDGLGDRAGSRTCVLHWGQAVTAGLASSLTDIFVRQWGHDTIVDSEAAALDAAGLGAVGFVDRDGVGRGGADRGGAAVRVPAAGLVDAGTTDRAWHLGHCTCFPAAEESTASVCAHVPHGKLIRPATSDPATRNKTVNERFEKTQ